MRTAISSLRLLEPKTLRAALKMLRDESGTIPIAGCTDVYVALNFGQQPGKSFLNIWPLDELRGIRKRGECLSIGALTTYTELQKSPLVCRHIPVLAFAASQVGGHQVQNRGTIGGNIGNASPAGDILPVLAVAEASIVLQSATEGARRVPFHSYFTGYRQSVRRSDELIVAVEIPPVEGKLWFRKVGTRAAQAIAKVVMAGLRSSAPRIALGSVAPTVIRVPRTEEVLRTEASVLDAQNMLCSEIAPINDVRSTAAYRRRVAMNLLARFLHETSGR